MSAEDRARKVKDDLDNCLKTIKEKKNDVGLVASDLVPLLDKILLARKFNSPILAESLIEAERCSRLYDTHVSVGVALRAAVNAKDRVRLRALITDVVNMKIKTEAFEDARIMMKQLEAEYKEAKASGVLAAAKEDPSEVKRRNKEASYRDERFDIKNFPGLRNPNEYAKAVLLDKAEMKAKFLLWQSIMIPKSLTELALEDNRTAMDTHLEVLKFCNDRVATQPAVIAQGILQKGFDNDALRDEIFMQLVKQVSGNPRQESEDRGWQLLCMVSGTFPPSIVLEGYLVHWLLEKIEKVKGFGVNYALYTLRSIQAAVDNREQKCVVPTVEEILAYKLRPPVSVSVELVNGFPVTSELPVAPDVTVGTLLELCQAWMGLTDPRSNTLGLFVYDLGPEEGFVEDPKTTKLKRSPAPTKITDFVGDIFAHVSIYYIQI